MITDILLFLVGILVGVMNAIAGGGGLVAFPALMAVGLPALTADATNFVAILPGQLSSAFGYRKYLRKVPRLYLLLLIPCALGAAVGAHLLKHTSIVGFEKIVPFLVLTAVIIFAVQPLLHIHLIKHIRSRNKNIWKFIAMAVALFAMTIYGGYFGVGFGFVVLALLSFANLKEIHSMNGMKNIASATSVTVAIISLQGTGFINWHFGLVIAAGNIIGGYGGSRFAQRVPSRILRVIVIVIGLVSAGYIAFRYH
ncbi:MAG: sulfite exporter TauE/SafE family protein [Candidatus Saccharimonadales bacterium]